MQKLDSATKYLDRGLETAALVCLGISVLGAVLNVFLRYVMDISFQMIEEICRYSIIYGAFLYVGPLIKKGEHLKMDILQGLLKEKHKRVMNLLISILLFAAFAYLSWSSTIWTMSLFTLKITTVSGIMLMVIPALAIPIGMILGTVYALVQIIYDVYKLSDHPLSEHTAPIEIKTSLNEQ